MSQWLGIALACAVGAAGLPGTSAAQNLFIFGDDIEFVSKNGDPTPFNTAEIGDVIVVRGLIGHEQGGGQDLVADGVVYLELGFDRIQLGTFTTPPIPAGAKAPALLTPNPSLPVPAVPLADGKIEWTVTAPSPWLHVWTYEITTPDPNPVDNVAGKSLQVVESAAPVPTLGLAGAAAMLVVLLFLIATHERAGPVEYRRAVH